MNRALTSFILLFVAEAAAGPVWSWLAPRHGATERREGVGVGDGKWQRANGKWQMANGKWQMADGRWQMAKGAAIKAEHTPESSATAGEILLKPGDSIQRAIDAADAGATLVLVGPGIFREHLVIKKTVSLLGRDFPVIDGEGTGTVLSI